MAVHADNKYFGMREEFNNISPDHVDLDNSQTVPNR